MCLAVCAAVFVPAGEEQSGLHKLSIEPRHNIHSKLHVQGQQWHCHLRCAPA